MLMHAGVVKLAKLICGSAAQYCVDRNHTNMHTSAWRVTRMQGVSALNDDLPYVDGSKGSPQMQCWCYQSPF